MPDGNILFAASPSYQTFAAPTHFFELNFSNNTITQVGDTADAQGCGAYVHNFLLLPTGQVLDVSQCGNLQIYTPRAGTYQASWQPVVSSVPSSLAPGQTYQLSGSQLNGLTEGSYYGDDVQASTNYPLVQITNNSTSHVFYARTFGHSTRSIAPSASVSTNLTIPPNIETGASTLVVIANGIPSQAVAVTIPNTPSLTVSVTGSGTVKSNTGGISCPSTCIANYTPGTQVTLTATAASGSAFTGWSGACSGTNQCIVTMNSAQSVSATFVTEASFTLTAAVSGSGTVTSAPSGINCGSTCSASFASGAQVTLNEAPASGWSFTGWGGACSGTGSCVVTMSAAKSVSATFTQLFTLSVSDTGSGTVTSSPPGINCGSTCSASFASGAQVTLNEAPASGWSFTGWGGACSGTGSCIVTMSAAKSVSATFTQSLFTLSVSVSGSGTLTSSPAGISCPSTCSANYASGTGVTLSAAPAAGWLINSWGGACSGNGTNATCNVTMNAAESASVTFALSGGSAWRGHGFRQVRAATPIRARARSPCLTFAAAQANTLAGGEIDVLSPGDYGAVTITQAISIYE